MCGIVGFTGSDGNLLDRMMDEVACRGPDSSGRLTDESVSLGHTRLAIVDLSSAGSQPMHTDDGRYVILYNGETYNHEQLRSELRDLGYEFHSETDTETVLKAYVEWGPDCLNRLNGMFAFVVYDKHAQSLFMARDHAGIKPLFYSQDPTTGDIAFASSIPALLERESDVKANRTAIRDFLLYNITDHTPETFFDGIRRLPKGHYMVFDLDEKDWRLERWWDASFDGSFDGTYDEAVKRLREEFQASVKRRLMSDVPIGTCLSGGIDSSAVAATVAGLDVDDIETFSAVFPGFELDESEYIETVCSATQLENHRTSPTGDELVSEIETLVRDVGEPIPTPSPYAQRRVFETAKDADTTVLLDGQGSDELFAGYHTFYGNYLTGLVKRGQLRRAYDEARELIDSGHSKTGLLSLGMVVAPTAVGERYFASQSNISDELYDDDEATTDFFEEFSSLDSLHDALEFYLESRLEHLLRYEDANSMAFSREARVPFLDPELMEFVFTLPEEYIISEGTTKKILRDALDGVVPESVLERRDKIGFATPEERWLTDDSVRSLVFEWFCFETPLCEEYIDGETTREYVVDHYRGDADHSSVIWKSLFLEAWHRVFRDDLTGDDLREPATET